MSAAMMDELRDELRRATRARNSFWIQKVAREIRSRRASAAATKLAAGFAIPRDPRRSPLATRVAEIWTDFDMGIALDVAAAEDEKL